MEVNSEALRLFRHTGDLIFIAGCVAVVAYRIVLINRSTIGLASGP